MSALDLILSRLPGEVRKAPSRGGVARAYRSACPACSGHGLPLSVAETRAGGLLLHCFSGCEPVDLLVVLGLDWQSVLPAAPLAHHVHRAGEPAAWGSLAAAVDGLMTAHCRVLAACSPAMQAGEIEAALWAILDAGEAMQQVKSMARRALKNGGAA